MTSLENREILLQAAKEAAESGARLKEICTHLSVDKRTLQRWNRNPSGDGRKNSTRLVKNRLSDEERAEILHVVNMSEYRNLAPAEIVAILAENKLYMCSERTIYRILKDSMQLAHRGPGKRPRKRERPFHEVVGPNQVFSWDITYLKTNISGIFFYLYLVLDIWSRKIVAWEIHAEENSELSAAMMENLSREIDLQGVVLHADNGSPMKGCTMLMKLHDLGAVASFSRPRVSEDNPYSESLFRTLKYRPGYPRIFSSLHEARKWVANFVHWYNHEHRHSGIGYVTPEERHSGRDLEILETRRQTYQRAQAAHPERWSGPAKDWAYIASVTLGKRKAA